MLTPHSEEDLAEAIRQADAPFEVIGGGTRPAPGRGAGNVLSMREVTGITLYEPGALTLVTRAGTPVAEIEAALSDHNQRLAFEPMDHRRLLGTTGTPTIGGVVAANVSGPRRVVAGAARDFLLGVRFVDGVGRIVANGGRVMKNVTGYDLVKLMAGSRGTLGILTEVCLKVLPKVETTANLVFEGLDDAAAVAVMSDALGSPFEVTGAAHDPSAGETLLRLEGSEASVAYRAAALAERLSGHGTARIDRDAAHERWSAIRDADALSGHDGDVWLVSARAGEAPGLIGRARPARHLVDWGGGRIWMGLAAGTDLRDRLGAFDGHATLVRAAAPAQAVFHPAAPAVAALSDGLRARFDPRGLLNPGLMAGA